MLNFSFVFATPQLKFQKSKFIFSAVIRNDSPNIICNHTTKLQNSFFFPYGRIEVVAVSQHNPWSVI